MCSFKSLEKVHSTFFEPLVIGTTFSGSPSIFIVFAGLSSLIKKCVQDIFSMYAYTCLPSHNMAFLTFGNAKLCGIIISDYNRHTNTKGEFTWKMICSRGG